MTRRTILWVAAALFGIAATAGVAWTASQLATPRIGLSGEPLSVASALAPPSPRPQTTPPAGATAAPHRRSHSPTQGHTTAGATRPTASTPAPQPPAPAPPAPASTPPPAAATTIAAPASTAPSPSPSPVTTTSSSSRPKPSGHRDDSSGGSQDSSGKRDD